MSLIVYKASAGSGKTYTLALKYISLAMKFERKGFTHVLAVTFTNKATGEMKDRILANLYDLARGKADKDFLEAVHKLTNLDASEIQKKAQEMLSDIMNDFDHFRVETIDSFFQSLLTNLAFELGLTRGFKVDLDDKRVISIAVERILRSISTEKKYGLREMVKESLTRSLEEGRAWNMATELKTFAGKNLFRAEYVENEKDIQKKLENKTISTVQNKILASLKKLKSEKEKALQFVENWLIDAEGNQEDWEWKSVKPVITFCKNMRENKKSYKITQAVSNAAVNGVETLLKSASPNAALMQSAQKVSDNLRLLIDFHEGTNRGKLFNTYLLAAQNLDTLAFMGTISEEIGKIMLEENTTLLAKTPQLFKDLVKGSDQSFVFERAGTTFNHIMIDEFQDTSRVQWDNFNRLLIESSANNNESLVVGDIKQSIYRWRGGDWDILYGFNNDPKKQTRIECLDTNYRSKPIVVNFNNVFFTKAAYLLDKKGENWHVPADWMEKGYFTEAPQSNGSTKKDNIEFCDIYGDTTQKIKPKYEGTDLAHSGFVRLETFEKKDDNVDERVMNSVYDWVVKLHEEYHISWGKMKMLVRKNKEGKKLIDFFAEKCKADHRDIKLTSNEAYLFNASPAVNALIYAMKCISAPDDGLSRELFDRYYELLCIKAGKETIFANAMTEAMQLLDNKEKLKEWENYPLYDLVMQLMFLLRFHDILANDATRIDATDCLGQSAYLFSFLDAVVDYLNNNASDLKDFLAYWDDKLAKASISSSSKDAIEILTIHKAKGLAGHTVLIPFADFDFVTNTGDSLIWCDPQKMTGLSNEDEEIFKSLPLIPIKTLATKLVNNSHFKDYYQDECKQMTIDGLNMLYVAFTRAKENMLIWSKQKAAKNGAENAFSLIKAFIDDCQDAIVQKQDEGSVVEMGQLVKCEDEDKKVGKQEATEVAENPFAEDVSIGSVNVMLEQSNLPNVQFYQSKKAADFLFDAKMALEGVSVEEKEKAQQDEYIERGVLMHQMLSLINTVDDVEGAFHQMVADGLITKNDRTYLRLKNMLLKSMLTDKRVKSWFDGSYENFNEKTILTREAVEADGKEADKAKSVLKKLRADRVLVNQNEAIVIDYKFGKKDRHNDYLEQVQNYMKLVSELLGLRTQGYLWYVYDETIVPVEAKE